jgi:hypothetical protein
MIREGRLLGSGPSLELIYKIRQKLILAVKLLFALNGLIFGIFLRMNIPKLVCLDTDRRRLAVEEPASLFAAAPAGVGHVRQLEQRVSVGA